MDVTKVGLVQQIIGSIGGNDAVLKSMINTLKLQGHEIILYTFSKNMKDFSHVIIKAKIPIKIPFLGLYQKWFMPKIDVGDGCDIYISLTGLNVKTKKPLFIYDQNNLSFEFNEVIPEKYKKGFWKVYYYPYKMFNKPKVNKKARYISNSSYCSNMLSKIIGKDVDVIYPSVEINEFYTKPKHTPICMIGRISPDKNLEFAVEVLNQVAHHSVIFGNVTKTNTTYYNKLKSMAKPHVEIIANGTRNQLKELLAESHVYFHTAKETFGISVVEAIASGCIPIVPDNSAHSETVPVDELRYYSESVDDAVNHLNNAVSHNYDHRIDGLTKHIQGFDTSVFQRKVEKLIEV